MTVRWIGRVTDALALWLALSAGVASALLAAGATVPDWLLLACGAASVPLSRWILPSVALTRREIWTLAPIAAVLFVTFAALWFGADQTPSRHWDGAVAWDVKNALLTAELTLDQTVFREPAILHHSRDYPLAQPLLVAMLERWTGAGRLVLPLVCSCAVLRASMARLAGWRGSSGEPLGLRWLVFIQVASWFAVNVTVAS